MRAGSRPIASPTRRTTRPRVFRRSVRRIYKVSPGRLSPLPVGALGFRTAGEGSFSDTAAGRIRRSPLSRFTLRSAWGPRGPRASPPRLADRTDPSARGGSPLSPPRHPTGAKARRRRSRRRCPCSRDARSGRDPPAGPLLRRGRLRRRPKPRPTGRARERSAHYHLAWLSLSLQVYDTTERSPMGPRPACSPECAEEKCSPKSATCFPRLRDLGDPALRPKP